MSREKQIEEMAKMLSEDCGSCENCKALGSTDDGIDCTDYYYARKLYNAGYRKQKEGEWVRQKGRHEAICSKCGREVVYQIIDDEWAFENYCPRCGAHMKGGAE